MRFSLKAVTLASCLAASACVSVGPNFHEPAAPAVTGYSMEGDDAVATSVQLEPSANAPARWWTAFQSPALNQVIADAVRNNQTLAQADARLEQARANARATQGEQLPQVNATASAVRERINTTAFGITGFPSPTINLYSIGPSVSFDLDLFGGKRRASERDRASAAAAHARVDAAYLTLSGDIVRQAVLIAGLRAKIEAQDAIVAGDQHTLDMVNRAIQVGGQPRAAADTASAQLAEDQAGAPVLRQRLAEARHHMALLVGRTPAEWRAPDFDFAQMTPPTTFPVSLPSDLVRRRPDILAAEADLHAATANIGVDTAALYPNLAINASLLQQAVDTSSLFDQNSAGWNIGPGITAPLFHGGSARARVRASNAAARESLATYNQTVLQAFVQVADVMQAIGHDQEAFDGQTRAVAASDANVRNAQLAYDNGAGTLLSLVDARRQASRARLNAVDARVTLYQDIAALFVATAADWRGAEQ